jgi:RNA polymerase sigma factor (sigma-70 family)
VTESPASASSSSRGVERLLRDLGPEVLAAVARRYDDFGAAEDGVQEALIAAATQWPAEGIPANPRGWLYHVAMRRITDHVRSEMARRKREDSVAGEVWAEWAFVPPPDGEVTADEDDTLALLFMCCHPALTPASAVALTLRAVGGLTTSEIASAFLVPESTMGQRISRAKQTIKASGIPFALPSDAERHARLASVLQVIYLIFNEGYTSSSGAALVRVDLSTEAIRLARMLHALLPTEHEVAGLLALMLLTEARRPARSGPNGELIPLDEQDRSLWDRALITEGLALISDVLPRGEPGPYQVQAAIAAIHDEAPSTDATDWREIMALYDVLLRFADNPMVALNRTIAAAMVEGPAAGLALLAKLDEDSRIAGHYRLDAVRAHLLERDGDRAAAARYYRRAAERTASIPERDYLLLKAARIS